MEQVNKEKLEREKLLDKIKKSIDENKEKGTENVELIKNQNNKQQEIDRDEIVENAKSNIDIDKVKKAKSLYELFDSEHKVERNQIRKKHLRSNINLGNVYY